MKECKKRISKAIALFLVLALSGCSLNVAQDDLGSSVTLGESQVPEEAQEILGEESWLAEEERIYGLSTIWRRSAEMSAFLSIKPDDFDWDALYIEYIPKVVDARDMMEYYMILSRFTAYLSDGKSRVDFPNDLNFPYISPFTMGYLEEKFIVNTAFADLTDIPLGSEIITVDGMAPIDFLEENFGDASGFHTPRYRETQLGTMYFSMAPQEKDIAFEVLTPEGEAVQEMVSFVNISTLSSNVLENLILLELYPGIPGAVHIELGGDMAAEVLVGDIHRIIIPHFADNAIPESARQYIESVAETAQGFILDARGNTGGNSLYGLSILRHFVDSHEIDLGTGYRQVRDAAPMSLAQQLLSPFLGYLNPDSLWEKTYQGRTISQGKLMLEGRHVEVIDLDSDVDLWAAMGVDLSDNEDSLGLFDVPVVILADFLTASAGDSFISYAKSAGDRFTVMGTNTMGSTGDLVPFDLPGGGTFNVTIARNLTHDGLEINNHGIAPDIWVEQSLADILKGRDTQLNAALEWFN